MPAREARFAIRVEREFEPAGTLPRAASKPAVARKVRKPPPRRASGVGTVVGTDRHLRDLAGQRIYYSVALRPGQAAPGRSAVIGATGVLEAVPRGSKAGGFEAFLSGSGVNLRLGRGQMDGLWHPQNPYRRFCDALAARMKGILGAGFETRPDLSGVYRAMMLGQKQDLTRWPEIGVPAQRDNAPVRDQRLAHRRGCRGPSRPSRPFPLSRARGGGCNPFRPLAGCRHDRRQSVGRPGIHHGLRF